MRKGRKEAAAEARLRVIEKLKEKKPGKSQTKLNVIMPDPEKLFRRLH